MRLILNIWTGKLSQIELMWRGAWHAPSEGLLGKRQSCFGSKTDWTLLFFHTKIISTKYLVGLIWRSQIWEKAPPNSPRLESFLLRPVKLQFSNDDAMWKLAAYLPWKRWDFRNKHGNWQRTSKWAPSFLWYGKVVLGSAKTWIWQMFFLEKKSPIYRTRSNSPNFRNSMGFFFIINSMGFGNKSASVFSNLFIFIGVG